MSCTWGLGLLWPLCPYILSLSLLIRKNLVDARGWSIYYQLACVTREGHGCCLLLFVCLRDKASFDTDSSQLICSLNTARLGGVCAQFCSSTVFYVCVHEFMPLFVCVSAVHVHTRTHAHTHNHSGQGSVGLGSGFIRGHGLKNGAGW